MAVTGFDDLYYTADQCRLRRDRAAVSQLLDVSDKSGAAWRTTFAQKVLSTWDAGRDVWIPKRLVAATPLPAWNWTEGDNPAISWRDLPAFFRQLDVDRNAGRADGFLRLTHETGNIELLKQMTVLPQPEMEKALSR